MKTDDPDSAVLTEADLLVLLRLIERQSVTIDSQAEIIERQAETITKSEKAIDDQRVLLGLNQATIDGADKATRRLRAKPYFILPSSACAAATGAKPHQRVEKLKVKATTDYVHCKTRLELIHELMISITHSR
jgi:hypothetical protein